MSFIWMFLLLSAGVPDTLGIQVHVNDCGGSVVAGHSCTLECSVSGILSPSTNVIYQWIKNNGSGHGGLQVGNGSNVLSFLSLRLSDAGQYTCQATVDSITYGYSEYIHIQIPAPVFIAITSDPGSPIRPIGGNVTLTCTMKLSPAVDVPVTVNVQLMKPNGITLNSFALSLTGSTYTTEVFVGDFGRDKSGNYSCTADVRSSFLFHTNSISTATTAHVTVGLYLLLKSKVYANNSVVFRSDIGEVYWGHYQNNALQCITDLKPCCQSWSRYGHWFYPNKTMIGPYRYTYYYGASFYRNRGWDGNVSLNHVNDPMRLNDLTGTFCCVVPDANWIYQTLCANLVTVSINQSGLHVAGESLTLMCSLSDQETDVNNFQFQWSDGQGTILDADRSKVINTSTLASYLYFTPLRQSHEGTYTCSVTIDGVTEVKSTNVSVNVPSISAQIVNEVNPVLGGYYALTCYIFGAQNINPIVTYRWTKDAGNGIHAPVGMNSSALRFSSLRLSDAGQYTCHVTVRSLYLDNELVAVASHNVILKFPDLFLVNLTSSKSNPIHPVGSSIVLTCTVVLDSSVNVPVTVNTEWTGPDNFNRNIMAQQMGSTTTYTSTVMVRSFGRDQSGNYTCTATVRSNSPYIGDSTSQSSTQIVTVGVYLSLKGMVLPNSTAVVSTDIGSREGRDYDALQCITDKKTCCRSPYGEWLFPNGTFVPKPAGATTFYRLRSDNGTVFLGRMSSATEYPAGLFCCVVPDANNIQQKVCIDILPEISVQIMDNSTNSVAGHRHILKCDVTGAEALSSSSTVTYQWLKNNSTQTRLGINSNSLIFTSLKLSDAGWYTCQVLISSPFLYNVVNATSKAYEVDVEVPQPVVRLVSDTPNTILSGSSPTLTCAVELDPAVDVPVSVATEWTGPDGSMLASATPPVMRSLTHYTSKAKLNYVESADTGTYTCSVSIDGKTSTSVEKEIVIGDGMFQLQLVDADICQPWLKNSYSEEGTELYKYHIEEALIEAIESRCECHFPKHNFFTARFSCAGSPNMTTYRNTLVGTHNFNSTQLIDFIQDWVSSGPRINVKSYAVRIDSSCHVGIASMNEPECGEVSRCPCANDPNVAKCVEHLGNKNFATCINSCI